MIPIVTLVAFFIFWVREPALWAVLYYYRPPSLGYVPFRSDDNFTYCHALLFLCVNPIIVFHYFQICALLFTFVYCIGILFYLFICYSIGCLVALYVSRIAYANLHGYNRGSLFRHSVHVLRCYCRDLWEGTATSPHILRHYISFCFLWTVISGVMSQRFLLDSICMFAYRLLLEDLHYGEYCRLVSIFNVLLHGLACGVPAAIIVPFVVYESWNPTLGDDDCIVIADTGRVEPMHPGYAGDGLLAAPVRMAPDGLCLYHCLVAAASYTNYMASSVSERANLADQLRLKTIAVSYTHLTLPTKA